MRKILFLTLLIPSISSAQGTLKTFDFLSVLYRWKAPVVDSATYRLYGAPATGHYRHEGNSLRMWHTTTSTWEPIALQKAVTDTAAALRLAIGSGGGGTDLTNGGQASGTSVWGTAASNTNNPTVTRGGTNQWVWTGTGYAYDAGLTSYVRVWTNTAALVGGGSGLSLTAAMSQLYTSGGANAGLNANTFSTDRIVAGVFNVSSDASAALEVRSTTRGLLFPRMTADQASAIASPVDGLTVYVTNTNGTFTAIGFWGRVNAVWTKLHL